jgi:peptide deformylase
VDIKTNQPAPVEPSTELRQQILLWPHPTLKEVCKPVPDSYFVELSTNQLEARTFAQIMADKLLATMYAAQGAGLSANQIGVTIQALCVDVSTDKKAPTPLVMFNPKIEATVGKMICQEGCLSVPGFYADVERSAEIIVTYLNVKGEPQRLQAAGALADALQHEIDHLLGITFVEKLSYLKQDIARRKMQKIRKELRRFDAFRESKLQEIRTTEVKV